MMEIPSDGSIIRLEDIKQATNNFAQQNIIENKYDNWIVYKGELYGKKLAFISIRHGPFINSPALQVLNDLTKHQNIVSLIGTCDEYSYDIKKIFVVEHLTRGGIDKYLSSTAHLTWLMRLNICLDIASALHFLQNHPETPPLYMSSADIHLDETWQAKIQFITPSAFIYPPPKTLRQGQLGYADPSYRHNRMQSQIYTFGVILFELLCARPAVTYDEEGGEQFLSKWACSHYEKGTLTEFIDTVLRVQMNRYSFTVFSELAYRCLSEDRPTISVVIEQLQKVVKLQQGFVTLELQQLFLLGKVAV